MRNRGTKEGTQEEINLVKTLNKKDNLQMWNTLNLNPENHYAVHVKYQKFGKINQKKVMPKADIHIAKGNISEEILNDKNFYLNEDDIKPFNLIPKQETGISVKLKTSKKYQITKMGPNTFKKVFGAYELGAGASIYCLKEKDLIKNNAIIQGWNSNTKRFNEFFENKGLDLPNNSLLDLETTKIIKNFSNNLIEEKIINNKEISDFIFQGIGNFEEPFTVHYLYENEILKDSCKIPFRVTTGSGRSKGTYTIVIKPK
ncbi:hypothetical protein [Methanobrevibacter sp. UBA417]|jgi:hypothetical protein|uniref:hypothetical protein n=1 Tax=Methanobrevibacter sp. UBA417 TaxID=1915487 RepID=UPI0039B84F49